VTAAVPDIRFEDFSGRVGARCEVEAGGDRVDLILDAVQELPGSPRAGGGFRLEFLGPVDPMIGQGLFPFTIGEERLEIFIVAIARDAAGTRYEAVFY
jgi:hypothetical protein